MDDETIITDSVGSGEDVRILVRRSEADDGVEMLLGYGDGISDGLRLDLSDAAATKVGIALLRLSREED